MIEFKEKYPKLPNPNKWGAALTSVVDFMGCLQHVVKQIDARVSSLEASNSEDKGDEK